MNESLPAPVPVVTIDGPGGSGKGTVARLLARMLGWHLLDSGALYRAVALQAVEQGVSLDDPEGLAELATGISVRFEDSDDETRTFMGARCIDAELRTERTGEAASRVARHPEVRTALESLQRAFARFPGLIADGRDMGTVIFPAAVCKFFLTASPEERARRRHKQLKQKEISVSLPALAREIAERDRRDSQRATAPLKPAEDAWLIDSTELSVENVLAVIVEKMAASGLAISD